MMCTTFRTFPFSYIKRLLTVFVTTRRANLRAGVETINFDKCSTVPVGLVFKLSNELRPTCIRNRLTKIGLLHTSNVQIFSHNNIIISNQRSGHIMNEIRPLISYFLMTLSNLDSLLFITIATFLFY